MLDKSKKEIKCDKFKLLILAEEIICAITKIKNGFINSTGWKRNIYILSHLLAPLTSTPKNGTSISNNKKNKKTGSKLLFIRSVFIMDIKIIKKKEIAA